MFNTNHYYNICFKSYKLMVRDISVCKIMGRLRAKNTNYN